MSSPASQSAMEPVKSTRAERQLSLKKAKAILEEGMQEFLAHGYAATSMDRMAISAGGVEGQAV
jgi:TetR/AcrR family transcriptional regulator, regulator of autoinduction and epiphytic fitness